MQLTGNTILITGGATGIGYALAEKFLAAGNTVITCGRRESRLQEAAAKLPGLVTRVCDVGDAQQREELFHWVTEQYPTVNVLINNAGIQRDIDFLTTDEDWSVTASEIRINLDAPIHLSKLFIPVLMKQPQATIIQVSSGLGFTLTSRAPVYSTTKAALHSFSVVLRHQLRNTSVEVIELIPPAVDSELNMESRMKRGFVSTGTTSEEFVEAMLAGIGEGQLEIGYKSTVNAVNLTPNERSAIFARMNPQ